MKWILQLKVLIQVVRHKLQHTPYYFLHNSLPTLAWLIYLEFTVSSKYDPGLAYDVAILEMVTSLEQDVYKLAMHQAVLALGHLEDLGIQVFHLG